MLVLYKFIGLCLVIVISSCSSKKEIIKSDFARESRQFGELSIDSYTSAPLDYALAAKLDAKPEEVWELIGSSQRIVEWFPLTENCHVLPEVSKGEMFNILYTRQCIFMGTTLTEDVVFDNKKNMLAYRFNKKRTTMPVPMNNIMGVFRVEPYANNSLVIWRLYWDRGLFGWMGAPVMKNLFMERGMNELTEIFGGERITIE